MDLVESVYCRTERFPDSEKYGLTNQIRRCAVSISSNIAEGAARKTDKEFVQFCYIALGSLSELVIKRMGEVYPELVNHKDFILTVLSLEEERFQQAFDNGYLMLEEAMASHNNSIDGSTVFQLWDTYGFPVEMTQEIAEENNISVDMVGFNTEMESQRERARAG